MLFIQRDETDPYFNLAAEEYIFRHFDEEVIMLWRNSPAVIVGKHQNPYVEVNIPYAKENNIPVIRRISGGGTVFHDLGNLNFTFIRYAANDNLVNYRESLQPVISILNRWSLPCGFSGKSDLMINNRKISGNSKHVVKNKVLHHGTLLFSSNLASIKTILESRPEKYMDTSVRSNPGEVANISGFMAESITMEEFRERLVTGLLSHFSPARMVRLSQHDIDQIWELAGKKYKTWEWNFGYSPSYTLTTDLLLNDQKIHMDISVTNGIIREIRTFGACSASELNLFPEMLTGLRHEENAIRQSLENNLVGQMNAGQTLEELLNQFF